VLHIEMSETNMIKIRLNKIKYDKNVWRES